MLLATGPLPGAMRDGVAGWRQPAASTHSAATRARPTDVGSTRVSGVQLAPFDDERDQICPTPQRDRHRGPLDTPDLGDRAVDPELGRRDAVDRDDVIADDDPRGRRAAAGDHLVD